MQGQHRDISVATGRGATVAVRDYAGESAPVVLLHGAGLNLASWNSTVELLSPDHRVVLIDCLGHGASTLPGTYSLHADVAAVEAVVETLGLDRPGVIGHSYGGILAVEYAATHPECPVVMNLDGLGGQGRPDHYSNIPAAEVRSYWAGRMTYVDDVVPVDDCGDEQWRDRKVSELLATADALDEGLATAMVARAFQPGVTSSWDHRPPRQFLLDLLHTIFELDLFAAYHRAVCPVVMVAATARAGEAEFARFLDAYHEGLQMALASNPLARLTTVDSGHNIPIEKPAWLAGLIRESLASPSEASLARP